KTLYAEMFPSERSCATNMAPAGGNRLLRPFAGPTKPNASGLGAHGPGAKIPFGDFPRTLDLQRAYASAGSSVLCPLIFDVSGVQVAALVYLFAVIGLIIGLAATKASIDVLTSLGYGPFAKHAAPVRAQSKRPDSQTPPPPVASPGVGPPETSPAETTSAQASSPQEATGEAKPPLVPDSFSEKNQASRASPAEEKPDEARQNSNAVAKEGSTELSSPSTSAPSGSASTSNAPAFTGPPESGPSPRAEQRQQ